MTSQELNFKKIEKKWQKKWELEKVFEVKSGSKKKKFYCLEMFPYPSGTGLHMGHAFNYTIGDVLARFKRMRGFNVLYPMGYDSFGLPAENAAIKADIHPKKYTKEAINNYIKQQKALGLSYDWSKKLSTCEPEYYKWNQFFFLKFLEKGLVYRKKAPVNWCPKCNTVLANEQAQGGKCWRHEDTDVEIKHLEQWFIKTTAYTEELLDCIDDLQWPERIKLMQKNWIGKSEGAEILFEVDGEKWPVFTTRPDTIFGVTFMVISAQHLRLMELVTEDKKKEVEDFVKKINSVSQEDIEQLEKEGVFTGSYAVNPVNGERVPIWAGNFVLADYGSGMVMAVPAHDFRDFDFAKKYDIGIREVVKGGNVLESAYSGKGILVNSGNFDGIDNEKAKKEIVKFLRDKKLAKKTVNYKLRDWLVSRQRYWGTPIPIIYCDKCGIVSVSEKDLPVKLPEDVNFGKGNPLESSEKFVNVKCPKCGGDARRETDTMDTFMDSSWYYFRYPDSKNKEEFFNKDKINYWLPVDQYIGGAEHACLHLMYSRFFTKALRDLDYVKIDEPFKKLFNQGMLHAEDGRKMSKSLGNVISPEEISEKYGIDTARLFLMSVASPDKDINWSDKGIEGSLRFLNRVLNYFNEVKFSNKVDVRLESKLNKTIKEVTYDIENFNYNLGIIKIRELFGSFSIGISKDCAEKFLKLLHPFCPHLTEELWENINGKGFISLSKWPDFNEKKIDERFEKEEKAIDKLIEDINNVVKLLKDRVNNKAKKVYVYVLPNEKEMYDLNLDMIMKKVDLKIEIFSVSDKNKYDPDNKSKKVKPNKPGIYLE